MTNPAIIGILIMQACVLSHKQEGDAYRESCKAALHSPGCYRDSYEREPAEGDAYSDSRAAAEDADYLQDPENYHNIMEEIVNE